MKPSKNRRSVSIALFAIAVALSFLLPTIWAQVQPQSQTFLEQLNSSLKNLADQVSPAVVSITTWGYAAEDDQDPRDPTTRGKLGQRVDGAGVILDGGGYIITNAHVIAGARRVQVTLHPARAPEMPLRQYIDMHGRTVDATIVGVDPATDLALLKIDISGVPTLQFANYESLHQGQMVIAFGDPFGIRNAATIGIVSSVAVQINPDNPVLYIETDAALNPGDSGGALVDTTGRLVGINSAALNGQKVGLAIPSDTVKFVYDQLRRFGRVVPTDIGMDVQSLTPELATGLRLARPGGVIVSDVRQGFSADRAGIQPQDVVLSVDGRLVDSAMQFTYLIHQRKPGDVLALRLLRGNASFDAKVAVIERAPEPDPLTGAISADTSLVNKLDIVAANVDNNVAEALPGIRQRSGVLVIAAEQQSDASLRIGDIIHAVNGAAVRSVTEVLGILAKLPKGAPLVLRVEREKRFLYLTPEIH